MPSSSGGSPFRLRSRLEPLAPRPSSPKPAPPAPASPGFGPFFLQAPASGRTSSRASAMCHVLEVLMPTAFPQRDADGSIWPRRPGRRGIITGTAGQLFLRLAVPVGEEEVGVAGARGGEDEIAAVGRPPRVLVAPRGGDRLGTAPVRGGDHDLEATPPARRPGEAIALRRPGGGRVVAPRRRDARESAAVEAHHVYLRRAGSRRAEGEAPPVGGPRRRHVDGPVIGEPLEELAATVEEVDVGVAALLARHEELRAFGRPGAVQHHAGTGHYARHLA